MIYQCRACQYEEPRGCLPSTSCGLYLMFLLFLSTGSLAGATYVLRTLVENHRPPDAPVDAPWWVGVAALLISLVLPFAGAAAFNFLFELIEWLAFFHRRCPQCGSRKWSWGATRGFGL